LFLGLLAGGATNGGRTAPQDLERKITPVRLAQGGPSTGPVIYVNVANTNSTQDGLTWATAFDEIGEAIQASTLTEIPEIWVAAGRYDEARSNEGVLTLTNGLRMYGGFTGVEAERDERNFDANTTIIDGSTANAGAPAKNVVVGAQGAILDGFVITGARGGEFGGGMFNFNVSPTVRNCVFVDNEVTGFGGGMFNLSESGLAVTPVVVNCRFVNNRAGQSGGAMLNQNALAFVEDCTFSENRAINGGAVFNLDVLRDTFTPLRRLEFLNCDFSNNEAGTGGAMANFRADAIVTGCSFDENTATENGGALFNNDASPRVDKSLFTGNASAGSAGAVFALGASGGGLAAPEFINCIFSGNDAGEVGGALFIVDATVLLSNCTLLNNGTLAQGTAVSALGSGLTVLNTIVWGNNPIANRAIDATSSTLQVSFSVLQESTGGTGNIFADPLVGPDYRLLEGSPCIDRGTDTSASVLGGVTDDFEGDLRGLASGRRAYDIGADESDFIGSGEGEGEGEGETGLASVSITFPNNDASLVLSGAAPGPLPLRATTNEPADTSSVRFFLDGAPVGNALSSPYTVAIADAGVLTDGAHTIAATAQGFGGGALSVNDAIVVDVRRAEGSEDANGNGIPDALDDTLPEAGDLWIGTVNVPGGGTRVVQATRFTRTSTGGARVVASASTPGAPGRRVIVSVDPNLLLTGETGFLLLRWAPTAAALLGVVEAGKLGPEPEGGLVPGGQFAQISILVSNDDGLTFDELDENRLAAGSVVVTMEGLQTQGRNDFRLFSHDTEIVSGAGGADILAGDAPWNSGDIAGFTQSGGRLEASLLRLSAVAPFVVALGDATIAVSPALIDFGQVQLGGFGEATFIVTNTGGGLLTGSVTARLPFSVMSGGTYALAQGQTQAVTIRFTPLFQDDYFSSVVFSGGGGATRTVLGTGISDKNVVIFGCGTAPGAPEGGPWGTLVMLGVLTLGLALGARRPRGATH
jgi:hypothetical protein